MTDKVEKDMDGFGPGGGSEGGGVAVLKVLVVLLVVVLVVMIANTKQVDLMIRILQQTIAPQWEHQR